MRAYYLSLLSMGLLFIASLAPTAAAPERPSVIVILADDLGAGDLSCYGHPRFRTPNIDRLAAEGVRMTQLNAPAPYCAPSRASLLTGRYPLRCGMPQNPVPKGDVQVHTLDHIGLPVEERTLANVFRDAGYRTACFGKWHLGHQPQFRPLRRGFDEYFGILYSNDMNPVELWDGERKVEYPVVQTTLTRRLTERAVRFIRDNRRRPFFLYLPHVAVHKPLFAAESFYGKSGAGLYGDCLADLDHGVGELMTALRETGLERKTLVVFASDNGPWYGGSTGGLRGMKGQNWEGGLRVPLIARLPGRLPEGRTLDAPANLIDLAPTLLAATGVSPRKRAEFDGENLWSMLTGTGPAPAERPVFSFRAEKLCTVRLGRWKLHLESPAGLNDRAWRPDEKWVDPRRPDGVRLLAPFEQYHPSDFPGVTPGIPVAPPALYDLVADRAEQLNLAGQHPEIVARLRRLAERYLALVKTERSSPPPGR